MVAFITNPTTDQHQRFAESQFLLEYSNPKPYITELVHFISVDKVYSESYLLYSLTKFDDLGTIKTLGIGIFGHIIPYEFYEEHKFLLFLSLIGLFLLLKFISETLNKKTF